MELPELEGDDRVGSAERERGEVWRRLAGALEESTELPESSLSSSWAEED